MSPADQIAFLVSTARQAPHWMNDDPLTANPAFIALKTSLSAPNLFSPEILSALPATTVAKLSQLAHDADYLQNGNLAPTPLLRTILSSTTLKPVLRALFIPHLINPHGYNRLSAANDPLCIMHRKARAFLNKTKFADWENAYPSPLSMLKKHKSPEWACNVDSIKNDDPVKFQIGMDISGKRISDALILHLLNCNAGKIVSHILLSNEKLSAQVMPLDKLAMFVCQATAAHPAAQVIAAIENKQPGMLKSVHDDCGNNLLWCTLYRGGFPSRCEEEDDYKHIVNALIKVGVDPCQTNWLGLAWKDIIEARSIWKDALKET